MGSSSSRQQQGPVDLARQVQPGRHEPRAEENDIDHHARSCREHDSLKPGRSRTSSSSTRVRPDDASSGSITRACASRRRAGSWRSRSRGGIVPRVPAVLRLAGVRRSLSLNV
jgi:hypothetical protein